MSRSIGLNACRPPITFVSVAKITRYSFANSTQLMIRATSRNIKAGFRRKVAEERTAGNEGARGGCARECGFENAGFRRRGEARRGRAGKGAASRLATIGRREEGQRNSTFRRHRRAPERSTYLTLKTTRNSSISGSPIGRSGPMAAAMTSELALNSATSR